MKETTRQQSKKLPKAQQELLDAITSGVMVHYMSFKGYFSHATYYYREDTGKHVTKEAVALINKNLIKPNHHSDAHSLILNTTQTEKQS